MLDPVQEFLQEVLEFVRYSDDGERADYIPQLREADPDRLALAMCTSEGHSYAVGDAEVEFSIQSISKPFVYALALERLGFEEVHRAVGVEPSGEAFNELSLDQDEKRPVNPMINAGAITAHQLIDPKSSVDERIETIRVHLSRLAGRDLTLDQDIARSEMDSADRNLALAHMLRTYGIISIDAHEAVRSYVGQCSVLVTVTDLAAMAATLANGGVQPLTGERVLRADSCRATQAVMASSGMYDGAGRWMTLVGIPAKSGVAGGLIGTMPGQLGLASFSPRLDKQGNSVRGVQMFEILSETMGLHLMSSDYYTAPGVRSIRGDDEGYVVELQGLINFPSAELIVHELIQLDGPRILLDISHVSGFNRAGRRLVMEGVRRLQDEGIEFAIHDPDGNLPGPESEIPEPATS